MELPLGKAAICDQRVTINGVMETFLRSDRTGSLHRPRIRTGEEVEGGVDEGGENGEGAGLRKSNRLENEQHDVRQ